MGLSQVLLSPNALIKSKFLHERFFDFEVNIVIYLYVCVASGKREREREREILSRIYSSFSK